MRAPAQPRGAARGRRRTLHRLSHTACAPLCFVRRNEARRPRRREQRLLPSLLQPASATTPTVRTLRPTGADRPQRHRRAPRPLRQLLPRTRHNLLALRPRTPLPTGQQWDAHLPHLLRPRGTTPRHLLPMQARSPGHGALADRTGLPELLHSNRAFPGAMRPLPNVSATDRPRRPTARASADPAPVLMSTTPATSADAEETPTATGDAPTACSPNASPSCWPAVTAPSPRSCSHSSRHSLKSACRSPQSDGSTQARTRNCWRRSSPTVGR